MISFPEVFALLAEKKTLAPEMVRAAFDAILAGEWTAVQTGAFAASLRVTGESKETIVAAARSLRAAMTPIVHDLPLVADTCGTGGDGANTLNLSTAAAIVLAACGVPVAKHGNRSVSSRCGSADVVEALGIAMDRPPEAHARLLREVGITFLFAPAHHPALRHAAVARRELGVRTIFNALGPLVNPARATHQIVGVYDESLRVMMAEALGALGVKRAWVVRSVDGLDEVSPSAPTRVSELREDGSIVDREISPNDFGLSISHASVAAGGSSEENAKSLEYILNGGVHAATDAVILNAAAALCAVGSEADPRPAAERARAAIDRGDAGRMLTRWREAAR